ncbi:MAG: glycosyltransferase family 39 protein [Anaerolineae bacterium]|nr:glycosyltransferase family 39 protein [Anaerolineae bacterium]
MITEYAKLAIGILVFFLLLIFPPSSLMNEIIANGDSMVMILFLLVFFILLLNKNGNGWETIQAVFVFALFAMTLIYKWQITHSGEIIGGLLPWSDAAAYNWEAHRLVNRALLSTWGGRRPLFSGFLAVLLRLTGDFMITLSILTLLNTLAVFFVVRMVKRLYGSIGAAIFLVISFEFYTRFSGTTLSEQLGFAAGNLALFFLLIGAHTGSLSKALFGLGLLTLALNARAGAFFILPILSLWLAFSFRQRAGFWRSAGLAIIVVISVFLLNLVLVRVIADPQSTSFSNYSYTLYGLASGNKGWTYVMEDHPGVTESEVMPLAIQKIRSEPTLLFQGILRSFGDYFKPTYGAFNFIYSGLFEQQINLMLWGLVASGLAYSILKRKEGFQGFILASFLGVIASVPLLPPLDSDEMRVYAATIPFSILWITTGVSALHNWGRKIVTKDENDAGTETGLHFQKPALFFSILLVFLTVPAPLLGKALAPAPGSLDSSSIPVCEPGEEALNGMKFRDASIVIIGDDAAAESYMPFIRIGDFQSTISKTTASLYPFLNNELLNLKAGDQLSFGLRIDNSVPSQGLWIISKFPLIDEFHECGLVTDNEQLKPYNFYYLKGSSVPASDLTVSQENTFATRLIRLILGMATGFMLFLLVMRSISLQYHGLIDFLYTAGVMILILPGLFVDLYVNGQLLSVPISVEERMMLEVKHAYPEDGNLFILPLGINWMSHKTLGQSPAVVYENGIPLKMPNSLHQEIREKGNGRYSVWEGQLYFSSSDNTDPRFNSRVYELEWPHPIQPLWQWISLSISMLGIALIFLGKRIWLSRIEHRKMISPTPD